MIFAVTLRQGGPWDWSRGLREQDGFAEHARFMDALVDEGLLLAGGPLDDRRQTLHMMRAPSEQAIRARWAEDPWLQNGMLEFESIDPWTILLDGIGVRERAAGS